VASSEDDPLWWAKRWTRRSSWEEGDGKTAKKVLVAVPTDVE
jgi:hypothetical protein